MINEPGVQRAARTSWFCAVHYSEDESFYVIEGKMTVIVDGRRMALEAGDFAFGPRGIAHGFRIEGAEPARILLMTTGSDFSDFISETSVADGTPPTAPGHEGAGGSRRTAQHRDPRSTATGVMSGKGSGRQGPTE